MVWPRRNTDRWGRQTAKQCIKKSQESQSYFEGDLSLFFAAWISFQLHFGSFKSRSCQPPACAGRDTSSSYPPVSSPGMASLSFISLCFTLAFSLCLAALFLSFNLSLSLNLSLSFSFSSFSFIASFLISDTRSNMSAWCYEKKCKAYKIRCKYIR